MKKRAMMVLAIICVSFSLIPFRLIYLSNSDKVFVSYSSSNRTQTFQSARGNIYDINKIKLVNKKMKKYVIAKPCIESADILKPYLDFSEYNRLLTCISKSAPFVTQCETYQKANNNYVISCETYERYDDTQLATHLIGYINAIDNVGMSGLEKSFDDLFKEDNMKLTLRYSMNADNKVLRGENLQLIDENYSSQKGIRLTIDSRIQAACESAMKNYDIDVGACVVLKAQTGEIVASASDPVYDSNNVEISLNSPNSPFVNRALASVSVGSIFKTVVICAALENNIDTDISHYCTGAMYVGDKRFTCYEGIPHGSVTLEDAFAYSCNTYFIKLGQKIGSAKIKETANKLGFGREIMLSSNLKSVSGNLPNIRVDGDLANFSFGQGSLSASPLQIAKCYGIILNNGKNAPVHLVKSLVDTDGSEYEIKSKEGTDQIIDKSVADKLKVLLKNNLSYGTSVGAKPEFGTVAGGKTSTAETGWYVDEKQVNHSWFAGFIEVNDMDYVIVVYKEFGTSGGKDCGPVFKNIADSIYLYLYQ